MIRVAIYYLLVLAGVVAAFRFGDRETRWSATVCLLASVVSSWMIEFIGPVASGIAAVDLAVLGFFVFLAMHTQRFWPLWAAGLQLTTVVGHLLRWLEPGLVDFAYAAAMRFWSYPILLIVIVAAWRSERYAPRSAREAA